jgi:hypothetical protein
MTEDIDPLWDPTTPLEVLQAHAWGLDQKLRNARVTLRRASETVTEQDVEITLLEARKRAIQAAISQIECAEEAHPG